MYFDGAVNSTGSGIGAVLISPDRRYYPIAVKVDFPCTNNMAEYEACILGLQAAIDFKVKELEVFGDSILTIFQTLGQWKTKDEKLVSYHEYLEELAENFEKISFTYTPRIKNQFADALATLASMVSITKENLIEPLEIDIAKGPADCDAVEATDEQPCMEVVLPIEVEIPSMRVLAETELEEAEWAKQHCEQLNLIDEKRLTALCHGQCYQQRMARAFNARVRHREFKPVFSGGAIILSDMDGTENALPVNADALKKYYP
ncbi:hypothetical protein CRG98_000648 [Punica granatum]|uniref:RNase H type-1 domain-containing protein n=1 Tax=Punica granatum TaxID=22663 RepID=A0A2I0LEA7_PUNGR|nr:hypothetical protein CRG98_000648 [Punica granatum]